MINTEDKKAAFLEKMKRHSTLKAKSAPEVTDEQKRESLKKSFLEKVHRFNELYMRSPAVATVTSAVLNSAIEAELAEQKVINKELNKKNEQLSDQVEEQSDTIKELESQIITDRTARDKAVNDEKQMLCEAMLKFTPKSVIRDYGKGYDLDFKHFIKVQLASKCPNFWAWGDENRDSFIELYNFLDQFLGKKFYDEEFKIFLDTMHKEGKQGPAMPKYDFNKLDLVSCNEFWQTIAKVAINSYIDARITKKMGEK